MNNTPLEDQVHDALHRRVDPLQHAPLTVTDVRRRAGRIQLRRRVAAGAAVAAVLAIAIPVGLGVGGTAQRGDVPPATNDPSPTLTGTVRIDPRSAEVVESTSVPLVGAVSSRTRKSGSRTCTARPPPSSVGAMPTQPSTYGVSWS